MDLARAVDIYCERVSAAFWAEPLNALTNIAFILAGLAALRAQGRGSDAGLGREAAAAALMAAGLVAFLGHTIALIWALASGAVMPEIIAPVYAVSAAFVVAGLVAAPRLFAPPRPDFAVSWLVGNAMVVGVGSFLFHTVATPWAGIADSVPILMFIIGYFAVAMRRFAGLVWRDAALATLGAVAGMVAMSWALRKAREALPEGVVEYMNSSSYYPAFAALLIVGAWLHLGRGHAAGPVLMRASGVFAVSLVFRTLDQPICDWFPWGTHFAWHLCNGALFWVLLDGLVRHGRPQLGAPAASPA